MRAHVIEGGFVVNTIEVETLDALPGLMLIDADLHGGAIGGSWDGATLHPAPAPSPAVPQEVSSRQFQRALLTMPGAVAPATLLDDVNTFVEQHADAATKIDWAKALTVRRDWPTLLPMAQAMGKTEAEVDQVFVIAASITN